MQSFKPRFELWTDAAVKKRWVYLPCEPIDTKDMDDWVIPVGARFWKEFSVAGQRIETRLIHRWGEGPDDFLYAAYQWTTENEATHVPFGVTDALGTQHDIPSELLCLRCHGGSNNGGRPSRVLGFSAIQLSHAGSEVNMETLSEGGHLTNPAPLGFSPPGSPLDQAALGYLHANCGMCHNDSPDGVPTPDFFTWLSVNDQTIEQTPTYTTGVGVAMSVFQDPMVTARIVAGDPDSSGVTVRMGLRELGKQMPPIGTEVVDPAGLSTIESWINSL